MFENVIGHQETIEELRRELARGTLPPAILLSGTRYSGKSTVALEIARTLTCRSDGQWGCSCRSCTLHRTLSHPDLVFTGPRYFDLEIAAALQSYRKTPRPGTLFLLIRAVRKLVRRFDAHLWPETKLRKIQPSLDAVEEILQDLEPPPGETAPPEESASDKARLKKLETAVAKLIGAVPREIVPVDLVRAVTSWTHVSSAGGLKVVLLEEAHTLQESARNSMLKLLEEPPSGVYLVLTSSRRSAIIPTVLSRLRTYTLSERPLSEDARVLERIFRSSGDAPGRLRDFFRQAGAGDGGRRKELAERIVRGALAGTVDDQLVETLRTEFSGNNGGIREEFFFEELTEAARRRLGTADAVESRRLHRWGPLIRSYRSRIESRNMHPAATIIAMVLALQRDRIPGEV